MSDRVYKVVKTFGANASLNAGVFAQKEFELDGLPTAGSTISTTWNTKTRTYTFTDDRALGANQKRFAQHDMRYVLIHSEGTVEENIIQTHRNLLHAINSNYRAIQGGEDNTLTVGEVLSGTHDNAIALASNIKLNGNITIGGSASISSLATITGVTFAGYTTEEMYTGISVTSANVDLLIRNDIEDQYNVGPPTNGVQEVNVTLPTGVILPIETFGCSAGCTVYR